MDAVRKPATRPPRDGLVRSSADLELRSDGADEMPTMTGHFAVFDVWTEINSIFEGQFLERFAPGAFKKTFQESENMRALFQHGHDPTVGDKPLGPIRTLREDDTGAFYEVPLLDTSYVREILPGLEEGLYGASFRFRVIKEEYNRSPDESDDNPDGIPERTVQEAQVMEFGPVTFPAYPSATAGVRSLTDDYQLRAVAMQNPDRVRAVLRDVLGIATDEESDDGADATRTPGEPGNSTPEESVKATPPSRSRTDRPLYGHRREGSPPWILP